MNALGNALERVRTSVRFCTRCFHLADSSKGICSICADTKRDQQLLCVVEEPFDILAIEKSGSYRGVYHVLGGIISPIDGIGPDQLHVSALLKRIPQEKTREVILATNPTTEGETTALYLARALKPMNIQVTRIARGLPVGSDIEYADDVTLTQAFENRKTYEK